MRRFFPTNPVFTPPVLQVTHAEFDGFYHPATQNKSNDDFDL